MGGILSNLRSESDDAECNMQVDRPQRFEPNVDDIPFLYGKHYVSWEELNTNSVEISDETLQGTINVPFPPFLKVSARMRWLYVRRFEWKVDLTLEQQFAADLDDGLDHVFKEFLENIAKDTVALTLICLERKPLLYVGSFTFPHVEQLTLIFPILYDPQYTDSFSSRYRFNIFDIIDEAFPSLKGLKVEGFRSQYGKYRAFLHNLKYLNIVDGPELIAIEESDKQSEDEDEDEEPQASQALQVSQASQAKLRRTSKEEEPALDSQF